MMDEAAAREIERLESIIKIQGEINTSLMSDLEESERQRKALVEHLEALGVEGINAATGAGRREEA